MTTSQFTNEQTTAPYSVNSISSQCTVERTLMIVFLCIIAIGCIVLFLLKRKKLISWRVKWSCRCCSEYCIVLSNNNTFYHVPNNQYESLPIDCVSL